MIKLSLLIASVSLLFIGSGAAPGAQTAGVDQLGWISGCWKSSDGGEEQWMKPAGGSMIGMARTIAGGKTVFTEYLQIREEKGTVSYIVSLGLSAKPVAFKLVKGDRGEAIFENPEHDFPQRIIYRLESPDSLAARIEGKEKGVEKGIDFRFKRAKCD